MTSGTGDETLAAILERQDGCDEGFVVIACAGPPVCQMQGDEAIAAANAGCPQCERMVFHPGADAPEIYRTKAN